MLLLHGFGTVDAATGGRRECTLSVPQIVEDCEASLPLSDSEWRGAFYLNSSHVLGQVNRTHVWQQHQLHRDIDCEL